MTAAFGVGVFVGICVSALYFFFTIPTKGTDGEFSKKSEKGE